MVDLIQEFFNRDLSEAEQESLSKLLEESPDAALSYEKLLEQNYLATGLPQPSLPKGLQSLPQSSGGGMAGWNGTAKLLLALLAAGGVALWKYGPFEKSAPTLTAQTSSGQVSEKPSRLPAKLRLKKPLPVEPQESGPAQEGEQLSIVVDSPQRSLVTVRILDQAGKEIRVLYTGFVEAGKWSFQWDGLLDNGEAADAGDYRIDVQTGSTHMVKDLKIELRPKSP